MFCAACAPAGSRPARRPAAAGRPRPSTRRDRRRRTTSGWPGIVRSSLTSTRPARSSRHAERRARRRRGDTPAAHRIVPASIDLVAHVHLACLDLRHQLPVHTATPSRSSARRANAESGSGYVGSTCGPPSTRMIRAVSGSNRPEVVRERVPRNLRQRAGQLDAGRPAADDHERQQPSLSRSILLALRLLEREQHPRRISSASSSVFSPGACGRHSSCPKYAWPRPAATIR